MFVRRYVISPRLPRVRCRVSPWFTCLDSSLSVVGWVPFLVSLGNSPRTLLWVLGGMDPSVLLLAQSDLALVLPDMMTRRVLNRKRIQAIALRFLVTPTFLAITNRPVVIRILCPLNTCLVTSDCIRTWRRGEMTRLSLGRFRFKVFPWT